MNHVTAAEDDRSFSELAPITVTDQGTAASGTIIVVVQQRSLEQLIGQLLESEVSPSCHLVTISGVSRSVMIIHVLFYTKNRHSRLLV
jgi:hypothetical protein